MDIPLGHGQVEIMDLTTRSTRPMLPGWNGLAHSPQWRADDKTIVFTGHNSPPPVNNRIFSHVWHHDLATGVSRDLSEDHDAEVGNYCVADQRAALTNITVRWPGGQGKIWFLLTEQGACNLYSTTEAGGCRFEAGGKSVTFEYAPSAAGPVVYGQADWSNPGDLYLLKDGVTTCLTDLNPWLRTRQLSEPCDYWYDGVEGARVHAWEMKPLDFDPNKRYPLVPRGPLLAVLLGLQLRVPLPHRGWLRCRLLQPAWHHRGLRPGLDPRRARATRAARITTRSCWGSTTSSRGPTSTGSAWASPAAPAAASSPTGSSATPTGSRLRSPSAPWSMRSACSAPPTSGRRCPRARPRACRGPTLERVWRQSPIAYVENIHTPLLILHATEDHRCALEQAEQLYAALRWLKRPVEMVIFVGESHGLTRGGRPGNRIEHLKRIKGWFEKYLGTRPA